MRFVMSLAAGALIVTSTAVAAKGPAFEIKNTSWTFVDPEKKVKARESVENALSGKHLDHGTAVMKDGKACFTSAMNSDGEMCWTTRPVKIGHSMVTTNDKGEKLQVKRVAYVPKTM